MKFIASIVVIAFIVVGIGFCFILGERAISRPVLTNADGVLAEIESNRGGYYPSDNSVVKLKPDQLDRVVTQLRSEFPFRSLVNRLPKKSDETNDANGSTESIKLNQAASDLLKRLDREFSSKSDQVRTRSLAALHSDEVEQFINREGFGFNRRPPNMYPSPTNLYVRSGQEFELPSIATDSAMVQGKLVELKNDSKIAENGLPGLGTMFMFHRKSQENFATPITNGHVKNKKEVAGFEPHRLAFSRHWDGSVIQLNKPSDHDWNINRVELVSLLLNPEPAVYVSDELPTMQGVEDRQTRPLTDFEATGLAKLLEGETIHASANQNRIELIGAIRMAQTCTQCHAGKRGKLLGAFTYEILRSPQLKADSNQHTRLLP